MHQFRQWSGIGVDSPAVHSAWDDCLPWQGRSHREAPGWSPGSTWIPW